MKSKCPCEECITYVMCKRKVVICCSKFVDYTRTLFGNRSKDPYLTGYWQKVNNILPSASNLREDDGSKRKNSG